MPPTLPILEPPEIAPISIRIEEKKPEPITHTVLKNETLTSIAEAHQTSVERLWAANPQLSDPDTIEINAPITIPLNTDVLPDRPMPSTIQTESPRVGSASAGLLIGEIGYAKPYGNCVDEPGVNSPHNGTNPISWPVLSRTPTIGATALFNFNHTGVVVGIWSDGSLEIRHQNYSGGQHRFPRSAFRGFR